MIISEVELTNTFHRPWRQISTEQQQRWKAEWDCKDEAFNTYSSVCV